jgi:hypothetical protein
MRRFSMLTALCLVASVLVSGPVTSGTPALASLDSPTRTTVQGIFTDGETGAPIRNACISIYPRIPLLLSNQVPRLARACTGADGAYSLPDLPLAPLVSNVAHLEAPGYGAQWFPGYADGSLPAFPGTAAPVVVRNIGLKRATAGLSVHLARQDGSPAPHVTVAVVTAAGAVVALLMSDVNGNASRTDIPAGDYKMRATGAGYAVQYYPDQTTLATATTVTLTAGSTLSLTEQFLPMNPMPALPLISPLAGKVTTADGTPIAGATVTTQPVGWSIPIGSATTDASGAYTIEAPGTTGIISVSAPGFATLWNTDDPLPVATTAMTGTKDFVLRPGSGTLRGTLTDSVPGPIPASTHLTISGSGGWAYQLNAGYDGTFEVSNMPSGTYTLTIAPPGRQTQQIDNLVVRDGEVTTADARLLDIGSVRVHVVDDTTGLPIAGATVTATGTQSRSKATDTTGYAQLSDYGAGDSVQVSASHKPDHFDATQTVTTTLGTVTEVTLRLKQGGVLTVPVINVDAGSSICLSLNYAARPSMSWAVSTECVPSTGAMLTFGPLPSGDYRAFLDPAGDAIVGAQWLSDNGGTGVEQAATLLHLTAGSTTTAPTQHFGAKGSITGSAYDPKTHAPVAGCVRVSARATGLDSCFAGGGSYRIDGLGPYAWPLWFESASPSEHASIWSGGAASRLDAKPVQVTSHSVTSYDFAPGSAVYFESPVPPESEDPLGVRIIAYDALTGDYAGAHDLSWPYSTIGPGPKLLEIAYIDPMGDRRSCWMQRLPRLRSQQPNGVYFGGSWEHPTQIAIAIGKNCVATPPPLVQIVRTSPKLKPLSPNGPAPRQQVTAAGHSDVAGAPAIVLPPSIPDGDPATFNDLVSTNFGAALQLALGALS